MEVTVRLVLVAVLWGGTNPWLKQASTETLYNTKTPKSFSKKSSTTNSSWLGDAWKLLTNWRVSHIIEFANAYLTNKIVLAPIRIEFKWISIVFPDIG
jgi:hypothetical protein